jgi:hypothetical protein
MIEGFNCPNCGAPADHAGAKLCTYCSTPFILARSSAQISITNESLGKYTDLYKRITKDDPDFFDAQISLVLIYIKRKLFPLADNLSKKILEDFPDESSAYLWRVMSLLSSGEIRKLKLSQAREIAQLIHTGFSLSSEEGQPEFVMLAKRLGEEYFNNHSVVIPDEIEEVLRVDVETDYLESNQSIAISILG